MLANKHDKHDRPRSFGFVEALQTVSTTGFALLNKTLINTRLLKIEKAFSNVKDFLRKSSKTHGLPVSTFFFLFH